MSFDENAVFRRARIAEFRMLAGGIYQVRVQQNVLYFEDVAALVWKSLDGVATTTGLTNLIAAEFAIDAPTAYADLVEFLSDLVDRGFVEQVG